MKSIWLASIVIAFFLLTPLLEAEKKAVTVKNVSVQDGIVNVEMDVEGQVGEMVCTLGVPRCVPPSPGKYVIATDETGRYQDCVDDVGLFPERSHLSNDEKIGTYCLLSPEDRTVYSCPASLTDLIAVNAAFPFVTMSVKNTSDKVVIGAEIGYASMDRIGSFTTASQSFPVEGRLKPGESFRFSTIGAAEQILEHQRKSSGVGLIYFLQDVKFADGSEWNAEPVLHLCGVLDEGAKKALAKYSVPFRN